MDEALEEEIPLKHERFPEMTEKIESKPLPLLYREIFLKKKTGIMKIAGGGGIEKKLCFREGSLCYALSSEGAEKLSHRLLSSGKVTREKLLELGRGGGNVMEKLVSNGLLSSEEITEIHRKLFEDILVSTCRLEKGELDFIEQNDLNLSGTIDNINMIGLLLKAAFQYPDVEAAKYYIGYPDKVPKVTQDSSLSHSLPELKPEEGFLLSRIDAFSSIGQLCSLSPIDTDQTCRLLFALYVSGLVEIEGAATLALPTATPRADAGAHTAKTVRKGARKKMRKTGAKTRKRKPSVVYKPKKPSPASTIQAPQVEIDIETEIANRYRESQNFDFYRLLNVNRGAGEAEISKNFHQLVTKFHPDKHRKSLAPDVHRKLEELFGKYGEAYNTLTNAALRKDYDAKLASTPAGGTSTSKSKADDKEAVSKESFTKGCSFLNKGDIPKAIQFLEYAVAINPDKHEYYYWLGKAQMKEPRMRKKAEENLLKAIKMMPSNAEYYYLLGTLYQSVGVKSRAVAQFEKALEWDQDHRGAQSALQQLKS